MTAPAGERGATHLVVQTPDVLFSFTPEWGGEVPPPFRAVARCSLLRRWPRPLRVCILGYGLGGLARLIRDVRPDATIVGIDPDPWMVDEARPWLAPQVELVQATAGAFLSRNRRLFDLVVDDCFELRRGVPLRPASCMELAPLVERALQPDGVYVRNLLPDPEGRYADQMSDVRVAFGYVHVRWFKAWENRLIVASRRSLTPARLHLLDARRARRDVRS